MPFPPTCKSVLAVPRSIPISRLKVDISRPELFLIAHDFACVEPLRKRFLRDRRKDDGGASCEDNGLRAPTLSRVDQGASLSHVLNHAAHRRRLAADEGDNLVRQDIV